MGNDPFTKTGVDKALEKAADDLLGDQLKPHGVLTPSQKRGFGFKEVTGDQHSSAEPTRYHCPACRRAASMSLDVDDYDC